MFDKWYAEFYDGEEWWHDKRDELEKAWRDLESQGVDEEMIRETFETVANAIRDQYGD